jgi:adenylate cyclase class 2
MAVEIELKVRLSVPEPTKTRLASVGVFLHRYEKADTYWIPAAGRSLQTEKFPASGVRVRRERVQSAAQAGGNTEIVLVTFKTRELTDGIEVNDEREFTVSDAAVFEDMLEQLGLVPGIRKEKRGWAWRIPAENQDDPPVLAELSEVARLGWFLELEILAPGLRNRPEDRGEETVSRCRLRLFALLEKLGIGTDQIEERPYSQMLRELE